MRIIIDLQGAQTGSRFRGIGRYSLSLALAIAKIRGDREVIIALNGLFSNTIEPIRAAFNGILPQENIHVWYAPAPIAELKEENYQKQQAAQYIREAFLASLNPDVILVSSLFEGLGDDAAVSVKEFDLQTPVVTIFYDLIPLLSPDLQFRTNSIFKNYYSNKITNLKRSDALLAISESSKSEGITALNYNADHIFNISSGFDQLFYSTEKNHLTDSIVLEKYKLQQPFVMYTGGCDEHKNLERLIQAYALLPKNIQHQHLLVFVGKMSEQDIEKLRFIAKQNKINQKYVRFLGYVSDEELQQLYQLCRLFIFPSLHEGFGLPPLEAMASGAAVISSNATSLPEVVGREDMLFNPQSVDSIKEKMEELLTSDTLREEFIAYGKERPKVFSWEKSAQKTLSVLDQYALKTNENSEEQIKFPKNIEPLLKSIAPFISSLSDPELLTAASAIANGFCKSRKPKLYVDITELVKIDSHTGIQRVVRSTLAELFISPPAQYEVVPVYWDERIARFKSSAKFSNQNQQNTQKTEQEEIVEFQSQDIYFALDLCAYYHNKREFLADLKNRGVYTIFVIYDLLFQKYPEYFDLPLTTALNDWLKKLSLDADGIICISKAVEDEYLQWYEEMSIQRTRSLQTGWFHLGADIDNSIPTKGLPDGASHVLDAIEKHQSFLMVGTIEPRKGHQQVLDGFNQLWEQGSNVCLVMVGKRGWKIESLTNQIENHPLLNKQLFWLDGVSDEYLEAVYERASCLVAASIAEGFGLPLIEAAQHKIPILARDIPVFKEVAGEYAYYFNGNSANAISTAVNEWIILQEKGEHPKSDTMPYLTWAQSTKSLMDEVQRQVNAINCGKEVLLD